MAEVKAKLASIEHRCSHDPAKEFTIIRFRDENSNAYWELRHPRGTVIDGALLEEDCVCARIGMTRWLQNHAKKPLNIRDLCEALKEYGCHKSQCELYQLPGICNCGFNEMLERIDG